MTLQSLDWAVMALYGAIEDRREHRLAETADVQRRVRHGVHGAVKVITVDESVPVVVLAVRTKQGRVGEDELLQGARAGAVFTLVLGGREVAGAGFATGVAAVRRLDVRA